MYDIQTMPYLVPEDGSWKVYVQEDLTLISGYLLVLLEYDDTDEQQVIVEVGDVSTDTQTREAVEGLRLIVQLSDAIHSFNHPAERTPLTVLDALKGDIARMYAQWETVRYNPVYFWLYPDQDKTREILRYGKGEGVAGWYAGKDLPADVNAGFESACEQGNALVASWLYGIGDIHAHCEYDTLFLLACMRGHEALARWLCDLAGLIDIHKDYDNVFRRTCAEGQEAIARWLYALALERGSRIDIHARNDGAFIMACQGGYCEDDRRGRGHEAIARWLYDLGKGEDGPVDIHAQNDKAFTHACVYGHEAVARWLYALGEDGGVGRVDIHADDDNAFVWTCVHGNEGIARWLWDLDSIGLRAAIQRAFCGACEGGHIEIAQWLYGLKEEEDVFIDIHDHNEYAFCGACSRGHLEVAQWLYGLDGRVDIHANEEYPFVFACARGHLAVAQWLYDLGNGDEGDGPIDIHARDDYALRIATENEHEDVVAWLMEISDQVD